MDEPTYPSLPRCAVVRYRREGSKVHWTPCNATNSTVAARVRNFDHAFELEQYSSQHIGIPLKVITNTKSGRTITPKRDTLFRPGGIPERTKPSRFPWRNWRKNGHKRERKSKSGRFYQDDIESSRSAPVRLRTAPNVFDTDSSERSLRARHSVHETPWCNGYLSRSPSGLSSQSSLHGFGELRSDAQSYPPIENDDDEFLTLRKHYSKNSPRWITQLRKRFAKRKSKPCEFDDRIGVFVVDTYY